MNHQPFQKCACQNCGDSIEFPAQGVGLSIDCPHCNQRTLLTASEPEALAEAPEETPNPRPVPGPIPDAEPEPTKSRSPALIGTIVVLVALAGSAGWYFKKGPGRASAAHPKASPTTASTGSNTDVSSQGTTNLAATKREKSLEDLKPGPVTLEKAKFGNLIYATGKLKNDSAHQRFGVKIEIECTDAKGQPAGKASDYTQVIEPGHEWRFRALVHDSKTAAAKVVDIQEDN